MVKKVKITIADKYSVRTVPDACWDGKRLINVFHPDSGWDIDEAIRDGLTRGVVISVADENLAAMAPGQIELGDVRYFYWHVED